MDRPCPAPAVGEQAKEDRPSEGGHRRGVEEDAEEVGAVADQFKLRHQVALSGAGQPELPAIAAGGGALPVVDWIQVEVARVEGER